MKPSRRTVSFLDPLVLEAAALAKAGISRAFIQKSTGYSVGQITYRVNLLRSVEKPNFPKGVSYYRAWGLGLSHEAKEYIRHVVPGIEREIARTVPQQLDKPRPKFIEARHLQRAA